MIYILGAWDRGGVRSDVLFRGKDLTVAPSRDIKGSREE